MNRQIVTDYIKSEFGVTGETLWMDAPLYNVFRNRQNGKWFAIIMDVDKSKLGLDGEGNVDIINVKCDPLLIGSLLGAPGYLSAYHMSKVHWISILLDGSAPDGEIKDLIHLSYEMVDKKHNKKLGEK
ncbi:MAG: MmcQ/YjbR family DNA-binding protein [Clostridia bacterium]|nr:MmcQ/YjbR family DNA-binding protein [Clostridia bacterium]MBR5718622.1 MmcQ/YjbR family DNA-binding protein [Clostridia bacterium]